MGFWASAAIAIGTSVASGAVSSRRNRRISRASELAGYRQDLVNARGNFAMTEQNALLRSGIAGFNAEQILEIASINETNIIKARDRNVELMEIEKAENLRRFINQEVELAGNIRSGFSTTGISVSSGSAKAVKLTEMNEAEIDRRYQDDITRRQILGYFLTETERAAFIKREGQLAAEAAIANAEFENQVLLNQAQNQLSNASANNPNGTGISNGGGKALSARNR